MGLFNNLKDAVKKTVDEKRGAAQLQRAPIVTARWPKAKYAGKLLMDNSFEMKAYVYYPQAMPWPPDGERFALEVFPGDAVLQSLNGGNLMDTAADGNAIALTYNGAIVGVCWAFREAAMHYVSQGYRVYLEAEKRGMYRENIPNLYVFGSKFTDNYSLIYD